MSTGTLNIYELTEEQIAGMTPEQYDALEEGPGNNPFVMVFDALWELVDRHPDVDTLFRDRNLIRFNDRTDRDPFKYNVQEADMPELMLTVTDGTVSMQNTSNTSMVVQKYAWLVSTGDMRLATRLLNVEWFLFQALHNWNVVLTSLEWPLGSGRNFVKRCDVVNVTEGMSDPERNRGLHGWSAVWACEVEMWFKTADIVPELVGS